ncbi:hypothetical protein NKH18_28130 [Streptomyces sp. M10(2022)]
MKPEDLTFHIDDAVRTGQAERIGHGVDLVQEDNWPRLARDMARRQIAVEVPLTSNAQILQVEGAEHPFPVYRAYGVPVVLSTDDPGVSRGDIGQEYLRAARTYGLDYPELKDLARSSLEYAFLPGRSLWRADPVRKGFRLVAECQVAQSQRCAQLLAESRRPAWNCARSGPSARSRPSTPAEPNSSSGARAEHGGPRPCRGRWLTSRTPASTHTRPTAAFRPAPAARCPSGTHPSSPRTE